MDQVWKCKGRSGESQILIELNIFLKYNNLYLNKPLVPSQICYHQSMYSSDLSICLSLCPSNPQTPSIHPISSITTSFMRRLEKNHRPMQLVRLERQKVYRTLTKIIKNHLATSAHHIHLRGCFIEAVNPSAPAPTPTAPSNTPFPHCHPSYPRPP